MAGHARIETFQADDKSWRWRAVAANGEIVATGEGHTREADATRAALTAAQTMYEAIDTPAIEHGTASEDESGDQAGQGGPTG